MKITKGGLFPGLITNAVDTNSIGGVTIDNQPSGPGQALVSNQSNFNSPNGASWTPIIQTITSNGSNVLGPHVNFASGSNITFSVASNTLTINSTGGSGSLDSITDGISTVSPVTNLTIDPHRLSGTTPNAVDYVNRLVTVASSGSSYELDLADGNVFDITLTANCTFTIASGAVTGYPETIVLILRQDATGSRTVTWPASVDWQDTDGTGGGSAPTLFTAPTAQDTILLTSFDGGTTWGGKTSQAGTTSPLTTKGDLYTYSTTNARLGVSASSNSLLVPDTTQTTGLKWTPFSTITEHGGHWELVMQDGVTAPPEPLENEAQDDWLYGLVP